MNDKPNSYKKVTVNDSEGHAHEGWGLLDGSAGEIVSITNSYYGFTIVEAPTSMKIVGLNKSKYTKDNLAITSDTELAGLFPELVYQPCVFAQMTITGGKVIIYKK